MALGFCFGRTQPEEKEKRDKAYAKVQDLLGAFEREFGTTQCRELIGLNLRDAAERQKYQDQKGHEKCVKFVAGCIDNIRRILKE